MWPWWVRIPIEHLTGEENEEDEEDDEDEEDEEDKVIWWWKWFYDEILISWNSQRSEKDWWLVTFRLFVNLTDKSEQN